MSQRKRERPYLPTTSLPIEPILRSPTLPLRDMDIPRRGASKSRSTDRTLSLGHYSRFFTLVTEQVTEG